MANISGSILYDETRTASATDLTGMGSVFVFLQNTETGATSRVITAPDGSYSFSRVADGSYRVFLENAPPASAAGLPTRASNLDFTTQNTHNVTVAGSDVTGVDFLLGPVLYTPIDESLDAKMIVDDENLITDFDDGTFGFFPAGTVPNTGANPNPYPSIGSDFTFVQPQTSTVSPPEGSYTIQNIMNNTPSNIVGTWWSVADRTTGDERGRMIVVNGFTPGEVILSTTVNVQANTSYLFTVWVLNLCKEMGLAEPKLGVEISGTDGVLYDAAFGDNFPINTQFPEWREIGTVLNSGDNTSITIKLISERSSATGNDYAIDNLGLYKVEFPTNTPMKSADRDTAQVGDTVTFMVELTNTGGNPLTNVFFIDPLAEGLSFDAGSVTANGTAYTEADPNAGFDVPNIVGEETLIVEFTATAILATTSPILNTAQINYDYTPVDGGIPSRYETVSNTIEVMVEGTPVPPPPPPPPPPVPPCRPCPPVRPLPPHPTPCYVHVRPKCCGCCACCRPNPCSCRCA
jgi:uncharacterized repeat protein (TIGR01451 family)